MASGHQSLLMAVPESRSGARVYSHADQSRGKRNIVLSVCMFMRVHIVVSMCVGWGTGRGLRGGEREAAQHLSGFSKLCMSAYSPPINYDYYKHKYS